MTRTSAFLILLLLADGCDAPPVPLDEEAGVARQKAATAERGTTGIPDDGIFRITPLRPVEELKEEALASEPPQEEGEFRDVDLVALTALDPGIKLDVRYATTDNFLSTRLYDEPRAFLQRPAAEALVAHRAAMEHGYGLLIHDAYRPWRHGRTTAAPRSVAPGHGAAGFYRVRNGVVAFRLQGLEPLSHREPDLPGTGRRAITGPTLRFLSARRLAIPDAALYRWARSIAGEPSEFKKIRGIRCVRGVSVRSFA